MDKTYQKTLGSKPTLPPPPPSRSTPTRCRNWLELPPEITASIISRLGAIEILTAAEKVCRSWRAICKDPLMWRTIDMRNDGDLHDMTYDLEKMCCLAVDRSCGQLVDITIEYFGSDELLKYITDRSSGIKRIRLVRCYCITDEGLSEVAPKLTMLEDLEISLCTLSHEPLEVVGRSCPLLKSVKLNNHWYHFPPEKCNNDASAVAGTMQGLQNLQLFGNKLTNDGLVEILDSCPRLQSLDMRHCFNLNLEADLEKRLTKQIKKLRLPYDSIEDYEFDAMSNCFESRDNDGGSPYGFSDSNLLSDDYDEYEFSSDGDFYDYEDFDDFTRLDLYDVGDMGALSSS
ncbi:F-box protein SKIP19-like [Argentina anserina]|uniref:F-box protein SKIP19-like n=1 Tax=Argentina anserina TaxID=57926 RepID=UPI002176553F|nr:F-box protein SKIP19-like [Potentilla anserina]